jgi:hypothetical protein
MEALKVFCYFNLHKRCFSIRAMEGPEKGRVIAHRERVILYKGETRVSEAGRQRVIREQRKNVHAGIVGYWSDDLPESMRKQYGICWLGSYTLKYNPYKNKAFVSAVTGKERAGYIGLPIELFKNSETGAPVVRVHQVANLLTL